MSKIGKINISIPDKVKVAVVGNILNIEGPLGKKSLNIDLEMFYFFAELLIIFLIGVGLFSFFELIRLKLRCIENF